MRVLDGNQVLVRIFLGESDQYHHVPLSRALLDRLRREGFAGATIFHGAAGFGASSVIHTTSLVELSSDLPVPTTRRSPSRSPGGGLAPARRAAFANSGMPTGFPTSSPART